jgi:putative RNA 2'-phosphotransferase
MSLDFEKVSKVVSHALRHVPESYDLQLDSNGWVCLDKLVNSIQVKGFPDTSKHDIITMVNNAVKIRHQIHDGRIRACYGHSTATKIVKEATIPPAILYHGTRLADVANIMKSGLSPMKRQYVHLSGNLAQATIMAARKKDVSSILLINAGDAYETKIHFYKEENDIWLSEAIPSRFIILKNEIS